VGAALLLGGYIAGLYVAAISMIGLLAYMISGAWLLIMGCLQTSIERPGSVMTARGRLTAALGSRRLDQAAQLGVASLAWGR